MIQFHVCEITRTEDGSRFFFISADGHATGSPEVCAGVSALLYTVAAWVREQMHGPDSDPKQWRASIGKGTAYFEMPRTPETLLVAHLVGLGARLLASAAPGTIDLWTFDGAGVPNLEAFDGGDGTDSSAPVGRELAPAAALAPVCHPEQAKRVEGSFVSEHEAEERSLDFARDDMQREPSAVPDAAALALEARHERASAFATARCRAWLAEAEGIRARNPDFDLAALARNRVFTLLLAGGVPIEQAWRAADVDAVARRAASDARRDLAERIRAGAVRPTEAGAASQPAFALRDDPGRLSDGQVRDVLARLERRERVSFG